VRGEISGGVAYERHSAGLDQWARSRENGLLHKSESDP
jgi:hypothetical protein